MRSIEEILKEKQPEEHKRLKKKCTEKLNKKDIEELMNTRSYRRINGCIRQVR